jgi:hypothetical protein
MVLEYIWKKEAYSAESSGGKYNTVREGFTMASVSRNDGNE